jgi:hypothetical protein
LFGLVLERVTQNDLKVICAFLKVFGGNMPMSEEDIEVLGTQIIAGVNGESPERRM